MKTIFGNEIAEDALFVIKPGFIGEITNGFSSLRPNSSRLTRVQSRFVQAGIVIGLVTGGWFAVAWLNIPFEDKIFVAAGCGLISIFLAYANVPSSFHHGFVGTEGMAEYVIEPKTREARGLQNVKFKEASFLTKEVIDKYEKGIYKITAYNFRWYNAKGELLSESKSLYRKGEKQATIEASPRYFGAPRFEILSLAEIKWNEYLEKQASKATYNNKAEHPFLVTDHNGKHTGFIYVRPGEVSVKTEKQTISFGPQQLKELSIENGVLKFNGGDYKVSLSHIGNASQLLEILNNWVTVNS